MAIFGCLRQLAFPKEFRIKADEFGLMHNTLEEIQLIINELRNLPADSEDKLSIGFVGELSTNIWRMEKRLKLVSDDLVDHESVKGLDRMVKRLYRMLERLDIKIEDFSGEPYDPDEIWDDVGGDTEGTEGVILEMGRPRVVFRGTVIQRGFPILGKREKLT